MITRSALRHTCFRMKNGQPVSQENEHLVPLIEEKLSAPFTWENFTKEWDIYLNKKFQINIVKPERDFDYAHGICVEASVYAKKGMEFDFDDRANNVISIVELNMLQNMKWKDYNKTWSIFMDHELKQIHTKHFGTKQNVVTDEMIANSRQSDGAALNVAVIPGVDLKMETVPEAQLTDAEKAIIASFQKKKLAINNRRT